LSLNKKTPSSEQLAALASTSDVLLIEALAGTGKTTLLCWMIQQFLAKGLSAQSMIALCFSEGGKTALEQTFKHTKLSDYPEALTFQDFAFSQLQLLAQQKLIESLPLEQSIEQIKKQIVLAAQTVWEQRAARGIDANQAAPFHFHNNSNIEDFVKAMILCKSNLKHLQIDEIDPDQDLVFENYSPEFFAVFTEYERLRCPAPGQYNWQSPFDYVPDLVSILRTHLDAQRYLSQYKLILVDEWHDVNAAEFELLQRIGAHSVLRAVGDRHQVINQERGAQVRFWGTDFNQAFANVQRCSLTQSRRFGVDLSKLISNTIDMTCTSAANGATDTKTPIARVYYGTDDCAGVVVKTLEAKLLADPNLRLDQMCIVLRAPDQSIDIENALIDNTIAYKCLGLSSYFLRPEIAFLRGLLHLASNDFSCLESDKDENKVALKQRQQLIETMTQSLAGYLLLDLDWTELFDTNLGSEQSTQQTKAEQHLNRRHEMLKHVFQVPSSYADMFAVFTDISKVGAVAEQANWLTRMVSVVTKLKQMNEQGCSADALLVYADQALDLAAATRRTFVAQQTALAANKSIERFLAFVKNAGAVSASQFLKLLQKKQRQIQDSRDVLDRSQKRALTLTTIEYAKGNEYEHVLVPQLEVDIFPRTADMAYENRLFYVAISRAKQSVTLLTPQDQARRSEKRLRKINA
jgi:DNA helicase II / ATP-dependent DNA helicase PcrA